MGMKKLLMVLWRIKPLLTEFFTTLIYTINCNMLIYQKKSLEYTEVNQDVEPLNFLGLQFPVGQNCPTFRYPYFSNTVLDGSNSNTDL